MNLFRITPAVALILALSPGALEAARPAGDVVVLRTPDGGTAPQVAVGADGGVHLVYFKPARGDRGDRGDLFYVRSSDGGVTFSRPLRVNSQPGSAMAVRHARVAVGRGGRVHVAWNGAPGAQPRAPLNPAQPADSPHNGTPLLYARMSDDGTAFLPQRTVMRKTYALAGGGTIAADADGNVYVVWHAMADGLPQNEQGRRVFLARSADDGKTFAPEAMASRDPTGACGCCAVAAYAADGGRFYVLFRGAETALQRDMYLLASADAGSTFRVSKVDGWRTSTCPMSTAAFAPSPAGVLAGWEAEGRVSFGAVGRDGGVAGEPQAAPGDGKVQKHPVISTNDRAETLRAWTEGMAWKRGGAAAWQLYDAAGNPAGEPGRADGVPADGAAAVFPRRDGSFVVMY